MIIKHIRSPQKWEQHGEFVFQCTAYSIQQMDEEKLLVMAQDGGGTAIEVFKGFDELYIMNDNGRTVDSCIWPKPAQAG